MSSELELYVHIPFCVRKCNYCDFLSAPGTDEKISEYCEALIKEIRLSKEVYGGYNITSIFIGGGTPSILSAEQMTRIIDALKDSYNLEGLKGKPRTLFRKKAVEPKIEFTVECNPGTLDKEKLKAYRKAGVNRLSLGLQSANDAELKELGRIHSVNDFLDTYELARDAGFTNINVDLMQAIPLQTLGSWKKGLMAVAALRPEHISAYSLIIEEGTPFYDRMNGEFPLAIPDEDEEREIYYATKEILSQFGYSRYEISNYALPGRECRHNAGYWKRTNYLGLGLGSSSMVDNVRWKNISDLEDYIRIISSIDDGAAGSDADKVSAGRVGTFAEKDKTSQSAKKMSDGSVFDSGVEVDMSGDWKQNITKLDLIKCEVEQLPHKDQMAEYMFLGLRMMEGVTKEDFIDTFGVDMDFVYGDKLIKLEEEGLIRTESFEVEDELTSLKRVKTRVCLTDKGIDISNRVFVEFV